MKINNYMLEPLNLIEHISRDCSLFAFSLSPTHHEYRTSGQFVQSKYNDEICWNSSFNQQSLGDQAQIDEAFLDAMKITY